MAFMEWFIHETSLYSLLSSGTRDTYIILVSRFLRMVAYGGAALVLAVFLWTAGNKFTQIGTFMTISLLGDAAISYALTIKADKIGRRNVLLIGSLLMTLSGTIFAVSKNYYVLLFAAIAGVITPGAHEVGPFRAVQESTLAQLTPLEARTGVYAWFAVSSTLGMAVGLCVSGWITWIMRNSFGWDWKECFPVVFGWYAFIGLVKAILTFFLTEACEADYKPPRESDARERETRAPLLSNSDRRQSYSKTAKVASKLRGIGASVTTKLSPESRSILIRLSLLFAINSFATGMLPVTIMAWYANYWYRRLIISKLGYLMAGVWLVASIANLFSAAVARRIGLVQTMVLTHMPNAIFLAFIPLAPNWWVMMILLFISAAFGSMDQAPRMAFVAAAFLPEERTAVMGIINFVRTLASAGGPLLTGYFFHKKMWGTTFYVSASIKVLYDLGLLVMFLKTKLPEQGGRGREITVTDVDVGILLSENVVRPEEMPILGDEGLADDSDDENEHGAGQGKMSYEEIEAA